MENEPMTAEEHRRRDVLGLSRDRLDEAAEGNPKLIYEWGLALVKARGEMRRARHRTKLALAQAKIDCRACPGEYGLDKVTDASVEAAAVLHPSYRRAIDDEVEAEEFYDKLEVMVEALRDRKDEIGNLTKLAAMMYFRKGQTAAELNSPSPPPPRPVNIPPRPKK